VPSVNPNTQIPLPAESPSTGAGTGISSPHAAILALLVEAGVLAIVIMIAGVNDDLANLILIFMGGLLLLFIIMHSSQVSELVSNLTTKELAAG